MLLCLSGPTVPLSFVVTNAGCIHSQKIRCTSRSSLALLPLCSSSSQSPSSSVYQSLLVSVLAFAFLFAFVFVFSSLLLRVLALFSCFTVFLRFSRRHRASRPLHCRWAIARSCCCCCCLCVLCKVRCTFAIAACGRHVVQHW